MNNNVPAINACKQCKYKIFNGWYNDCEFIIDAMFTQHQHQQQQQGAIMQKQIKMKR